MSLTHIPWNFRDAVKVMLWIFILFLGLNIALIETGIDTVVKTSNHRSLWTLGFFLVQEVLLLAPLYWVVIKKYRVTKSDMGFRAVPWKILATWILRGFGAVFVFNFLAALIFSRWGGDLPGFQGQTPYLPLFGESNLDLVLAILVLVIIAPIVEEVLFRGFLLQTLEVNFSPRVASLMTAFAFGAAHFEFQSMGIIIFLALVLNWMFLGTRSLWPAIIFHMINNSFALWLEWMVSNGKIPV